MENRKLVSMVDYVLWLHSMTTKELCDTLPKHFRMPVCKGSQSEMVKDMLAIDAIKSKLMIDYAKFLRQSLTLGMFVPVGEDGEVLEEPEMYGWLQNVGSMNSHATEEECVQCEIYHKAKSRCIFEGFEVDEAMNITCGEICSGFYYDKGEQIWKLSAGIRTIEDLVPYNLTLTENALR